MPDSREGRKRILARAGRVVVKVGSAVLTTERGLNPRVFSRLVDQLAALHDKGLDIVLVSSGAVACGRTCLDTELVADVPSKQAASAIGQSRLMHEYDATFARYGKITAQVLLTREDFKHRDRFLNARNTICRLLDWRVIPIINENDSVSIKELEFGDNDTLAALMLNLMEADLFVNLTSAQGVFDKNPDVGGDPKRLPVIENISALDIESMCSGKTSTGSGGMYSKLTAARRAAQLGAPTLIISGLIPFSLEKAFAGEDLGTLILPEEKPVSGRKFWMAYHDTPVGDVVVDQGAARALTTEGKSLLAAGITAVKGDFEEGGLVRILSQDGVTVGVGVSNYSSKELARIKGHKTPEIDSILGKGPHSEAVHRDELLLDPAL